MVNCRSYCVYRKNAMIIMRPRNKEKNWFSILVEINVKIPRLVS